MTLAEVIERFGTEFLARHDDRRSNDVRRAVSAMRWCRSAHSPHWQAQCTGCEASLAGPHSCGHRSCPHCQHGTGEAWRQRQCRRLLPVDYFLVTFTLPAQLRHLARQHPRRVYGALMQCAWSTLASFARNDRRLGVELGATAVLHTHSRTRDFHPHVHLLVPAGGLDPRTRLWRSTRRFLFRAGNLARVFRARMLAALRALGLTLPDPVPATWVADCTRVGRGEQALGYLARYLYRGVLSERDLLGCEGDHVRFRYRDSTGQTRIRCLHGADFLALLLQHVLPKGFRRVRDFGLLHPRRKTLLARVQLLLQVHLPDSPPLARCTLHCTRCGAAMRIVATRLTPAQAHRRRTPHHDHRSLAM
jgi:predicted RNA-binding Zn-ribbon protein involved in translation (DUF1610 family)